MEKAGIINDILKREAYFSGDCHSNAYPSVYNLETTNRCYYNCNHCPRPYIMKRPSKDMDLGLLQNILDQVQPFAQSVFFSDRFEPILPFVHYGDPTLYRHYAQAIQMTRYKGLSTLVSSTSSSLNKEIIKASVDYQLDYLWLIFDGMDNQTFKKIRGNAADFDKGIRNIEGLIRFKEKSGSKKPLINAVMIKHPYNRHQWEEFLSYFRQIQDTNPILAHFSTFAGNVEQICAFHKALQKDEDERKEWDRVSRLNSHICYYPWFSVSILSDGRVVPCCRDINGDYELGDLNRESLSDIWNGDKIKMLRKRFINGDRDNPLCRNCKEGSLEIGIPPRINLIEGEMVLKFLSGSRY